MINQLILLCDCRSEILVIEYDKESKIADLAIYETFASYNSKFSLWQRLRYCYQILINKKPYSDQMVLNYNQLYEIKQFIESINDKEAKSSLCS